MEEEKNNSNLISELNDFPDLGIKITKPKNYTEVGFIVLISILIWVILGVLQSIFWKMVVGTSGYTFGILPGVIIGFIIGSITSFWGKDIGMLSGALIGVILNFFCVATSNNPLPIDKEIAGFMVRVPLFVAVPGGLFAVGTAYFVFLAKEKFLIAKKIN